MRGDTFSSNISKHHLEEVVAPGGTTPIAQHELQRQDSFREKFRSVEVRDYTAMRDVNKSIRQLSKEPICSDCFKVETKSIFKSLNFDKKDFLREIKNIKHQIINLDKFKYP